MKATAISFGREAAWWTFVHGFLVVGVLVIATLAGFDARARAAERKLALSVAPAAAAGYSNVYIARMMRRAGPAALRVAARYERGFAPFNPFRPTGLSAYSSRIAPVLPFRTDADATRLNAVIPVSRTYNPVAKPFVLEPGVDREQAINCLTAAIYYEAANEPRHGKEAVAQVVINRTRHPLYPKSVCGVVFQGSERYTGCQFSFTCDGSMARGPARAQWAESRDVAVRAVSGAVMQSVGSATHYHANYVLPYWAPTLVKVAQFGLHVFYRPTGPSRLFSGYRGGEARFSKVNLIGKPQPFRGPPVLAANGQFQQFPPGFLPVQIARAAYTPDGRVRAVIGGVMQNGAAPVAPMHAMIAMRRAAAKAAFNERSAAAAIRQDDVRARAQVPETAASTPSAPLAEPASAPGRGAAYRVVAEATG